MNTLIINGFTMFPVQPPPSTAYLCGLLRKNRVKTKQLDVGIELWDYFLSAEYLAQLVFRPECLVNSPCPYVTKINSRKFNDLKKYVVMNIERAKMVLRDKNEFFDFDKLSWAFGVIFQAQSLIYYQYGTLITNHLTYWPYIGFEVNSLEKIYHLSSNPDLNPFINAMEEVILPILNEVKPDLIFVDILFPWEIIMALTLNQMIKKHFPLVHINFAGQGFDEFSFSRLRNRIEHDQRLFFGFDSLFLYRNDMGVVELVQSLGKNNNESLSSITNLSYIDENKVTINKPLVKKFKHIDGILPDYDDLPLKKYFTPTLVFADKLSSRCFWAKCSFCSINTDKEERHEISLEESLKKFEYYNKRYDCNHLFLLDEACTPEYMDKFASKILEKKMDLVWSIRTRIDDRLDYSLLKKIHSAGCRELWIGLEAVSPELLKVMNKTEEPDAYAGIAARIMSDCNEIGIGIHFCLMFGFPSENDVHRQQVIDYFNSNRRRFNKMPIFSTLNNFSLMYDSYIYNHPDEFNISLAKEDTDNFNMISVPYQIKGENEQEKQKRNKKIDDCMNSLLKIFVQDEAMILTWLNISDSPYELLVKEHCNQKPGNIFQKKNSPLASSFFKLYLLLAEAPFVSVYWKNFCQKYFLGIK